MTPRDTRDEEERLQEARDGIAWLAKQETGDFLLEERLGAILRYGVRVSTACLVVGLVWSLATGGSVVASMVINVGILALMATPVLRVAVAVADYGFGRDWLYFTLTAIVLLELSAGIIAALVFHTRL